MGSKERLTEKLESVGYNRDIEVSRSTWLDAKEELEAGKSILGIPSILRIKEPIFRDKNRVKSVELKDYRRREDFSADFVAELEHFNPEHHIILHSLVDVPIWALKNRVLNNGPKPANTNK